MPEPVIVIDEVNASGLAQAGANSAVPCRKPTDCRCNPVGWCTGAETLGVSTVIDTEGAYDSVRIELHRVGAGFRPGSRALDLLDLSLSHTKFRPARREFGRCRTPRPQRRRARRRPPLRLHRIPDRTSLTRWWLTTAIAISGPFGRTRLRGRGGRPRKVGEYPDSGAVSTPARVPGRYSQPRAG